MENTKLKVNLRRLGTKIRQCEDCKRMECVKGCTCDCHQRHHKSK